MKKTMRLILSLIIIICCLPTSIFVANASGSVPATTIVDNAKSLVDKYPYVWGGESPQEGGFDCSGLVWYVYNQMSGVDISLSEAGRSKSALANAGTKIVGIHNFLPGDIVQFEYAHVAIYIGDNTIIEAPSTGQNVKYTTIGPNSQVEYAIRLSSVYNGPEMIGYRRTDSHSKNRTYYFKGFNEPLGSTDTTYLTVSNIRYTNLEEPECNWKSMSCLYETTVTIVAPLEQFQVYYGNRDTKTSFIIDEKNVKAGTTYTFKNEGHYEFYCNRISYGIVDIEYDPWLYDTYADELIVTENPEDYIPVYLNSDGTTSLVLEQPSIITAYPTDSEIVVESGAWNLNAYNINDNNYFRLRDLAFAFSYESTIHPFDVTWDADKNAINIISNKKYTPVGGECGGYNIVTGELPTSMNNIEKTAKTALLTTSETYINGIKVNLTAYNIDGNNYFKLRDLGQALDFEVNWIAEHNMIYVSTYGSYQDETETDSGYEDENYEELDYGNNDRENQYYEDEHEEVEDFGTRSKGEYLLTFEKSDGGVIIGDAGYHKPGEKITIRARSNKDFGFMSWSSDFGGEFYNVFKSETTFTMPANDVVISASYIMDYGNDDTDDSYNSDRLDRYDGQNINLNKYVQLKLNMIGCGSYRNLSGPYHPGQVVELSIGSEDEDIFLGWSSNDVELPTPYSPKCKIVIPDHDVTVTATFSK